MASFLSADERTRAASLGVDVQWIITRAEDRIATLTTEKETLSAQLISVQAAAEKSCNNVEHRFMKTQQDLTHANSVITTQRRRIQELEAELASTHGNVSALQSKLDTVSATSASFKADVKHLTETLEQRSAALATLQRQFDDAQTSLLELRRAMQQAGERESEANRARNDAEAQIVPLKLQTERLERERTQLKEHVAVLNQELDEKLTALKELRNNTSAHIAGLEAQVQTLTQNLQSRDAQVEERTNAAAEQRRICEQLQHELVELKANVARDAQLAAEKLDVTQRLVNTHKNAAEAAAKRVAELETMLRQTRQQAVEHSATSEDHIKQLTNALNDATARADKAIADAESARAAAAAAIAAATPGSATPASVSQLSATQLAAAVADQAARFGGFSATDMYRQLEEAQSALRSEQERSARLEACLQQIYLEIDSKAPIIAEQRRDHERALAAHHDMTVRLDSATKELTATHAELTALRTKYEREVGKVRTLQRESEDLALQVRTLLQQQVQGGAAEPAFTGTLPGTPAARMRLSAVSPPSGGGGIDEPMAPRDLDEVNISQLIEENVITFKSVGELQRRNQQLIRVVRQLADKQTAELDKARVSAQFAATTGLQAALTELETLRRTRQDQEEAVKTIVHQRDMYRALLAQAERGTLPAITAGAAASSTSTALVAPSVSAAEVAELKVKLAATEKALEDMRTECGQLRVDRRTAEREIIAVSDKFQSEIASLRTTAARAEADAQFSKQQADRLERACEAFRAEAAQERKFKSDTQTLLLQHQQALSQKEATLQQLKDELARRAHELSNAKAERDIATASEERVRAHMQAVQEDRLRLTTLLEGVQTMRADLEASERQHVRDLAAERDRLRADVDRTRAQLEAVRAELISATESHAAAARVAMSKSEEAASEINRLRESLSTVTAEKEAAVASSTTLKAQLEALQGRLEGQVAALSSKASVDDTHVAQMELRVRQADAEMVALRAQLADKEKHVAQYRALSKANEDSLSKLLAAHEEAKLEQQAIVARANAEVASLQAALQKAREDANKYVREQQAALDAASKAEAELRSQLAAAKSAEEAAQAAAAQATAQMESLREETKTHEEARRTAQANFDRQLQMHAADSRQLAEAQAKVASLTAQLHASENKVAELTAELIAAQQSWAAAETTLKAQAAQARAAAEELREQNLLLHTQFASLQAAAQSAQELRALAGSTGTAGASGDAEALSKIVVYLRRELEVASCNKEIAEQEVASLRGQLSAVTRSLDEARVELRSIKELHAAAQVSGQTAARIAELTQEMSVLRESNTVLRNDLQEQASRRQTAEAKVTELQESLAPTQAKIRTLESQITAHAGEKESLQRLVSQWQTKFTRVLEAHEQVDPEEHKRLVERCKLVEQQLSEATASLRAAQASQRASEEQAARLQTSLTAVQQQHAAATSQLATLQTNLDAKTTELETSENGRKKLRDFAKKTKDALDGKEAELIQLREELSRATAAIAASATAGAASPADATAAQAHVADLHKQVQDKTAELTTAQAAVTSLQQQLDTKTSELAASSKKFDALKSLYLKAKQEVAAANAAVAAAPAPVAAAPAPAPAPAPAATPAPAPTPAAAVPAPAPTPAPAASAADSASTTEAATNAATPPLVPATGFAGLGKTAVGSPFAAFTAAAGTKKGWATTGGTLPVPAATPATGGTTAPAASATPGFAWAKGPFANAVGTAPDPLRQAALAALKPSAAAAASGATTAAAADTAEASAPTPAAAAASGVGAVPATQAALDARAKRFAVTGAADPATGATGAPAKRPRPAGPPAVAGEPADEQARKAKRVGDADATEDAADDSTQEPEESA